jgi:hypothetical protein
VLFVSNLILQIIFSCPVFFSFDTALDFVFFYLMSASPVLAFPARSSVQKAFIRYWTSCFHFRCPISIFILLLFMALVFL